jgi:hypothetical protein
MIKPSSPQRSASSRDKVRLFRQRRREQGWRKFEIWVPDLENPEFRARVAEQCKSIAAGQDSAGAQAFIDSHNDALFDSLSAAEMPVLIQAPPTTRRP